MKIHYENKATFEAQNIWQDYAKEGAGSLSRRMIDKKLRQEKNGISLELNIDTLHKIEAEKRILFLTVTLQKQLNMFKQDDHRQAQKAFRKFNERCLSRFCTSWVKVIEPQSSGRIHWHLVCRLKFQYRTNQEKFDWNLYNKITEIKKLKGKYHALKNWNGFPENLKKIWSWINSYSQRSSTIGLCEAVPVRSGESAGKYISQYLSKDASLFVPHKFRRLQYALPILPDRLNSPKFTRIKSSYREKIRSYIKEKYGFNSDDEAAKNGLSYREATREYQLLSGFLKNLIDR